MCESDGESDGDEEEADEGVPEASRRGTRAIEIDCVISPGLVGDVSNRVLSESFQEDSAIDCGSENAVRLAGSSESMPQGVKERPRPESGSWFSRFEGDPSKAKSDFKPDLSSCTSVFVGNIPPMMSHKKLRARFSAFGPVVGVFISQRRSKIDGSFFSFVRFRSLADARRACAETDGSLIEGFFVVANLARFARSGTASQSKVSASSFGVLPLQTASVHGKASFLQVLKFRGRDVGPSIKVVAEACAGSGVFVEDASFLDAVSINKSGINCNFVNSYGAANCVRSGHEIESSSANTVNQSGCSSGIWSCDESLDYVACCAKECGFSSVGPLSEAELRGWVCLKSGCESPVVSHDEFSTFGIGKADKFGGSDLGFLDPVVSGLCAKRTGCGAKGAMKSEYLSLRLCSSVAVVSEDQMPISLLSGGVNGENAKDLGVDVPADGPLSKAERAKIAAEVRFIIHDALQIGKAMGVNFTPRDERMI